MYSMAQYLQYCQSLLCTLFLTHFLLHLAYEHVLGLDFLLVAWAPLVDFRFLFRFLLALLDLVVETSISAARSHMKKFEDIRCLSHHLTPYEV